MFIHFTNEKECADAMVRFLNKPHFAERMRQKRVETTKGHFSWYATVERHIRFYERFENEHYDEYLMRRYKTPGHRE